MNEVLEILSSIRGGANDVIDVTFVQVWLSSLIFLKHFSLDVTNEQARIVGPQPHPQPVGNNCHENQKGQVQPVEQVC